MPLGLLKVTKWATSGGHKNTEKEITMAESASSQSLFSTFMQRKILVKNFEAEGEEK